MNNEITECKTVDDKVEFILHHLRRVVGFLLPMELDIEQRDSILMALNRLMDEANSRCRIKLDNEKEIASLLSLGRKRILAANALIEVGWEAKKAGMVQLSEIKDELLESGVFTVFEADWIVSALRRTGINTVDDILKMSKDKLADFYDTMHGDYHNAK